MKNIICIVIVIFLLFSSLLQANDKVIVIPLNSTSVVSDNFYPVYDIKNVFVGHYFLGLPDGIVSPQKYWTTPNMTTGEHQNSDLFFTTPDCTGEQYGGSGPISESQLLIFGIKGKVFRDPSGSAIYNPPNTSPIIYDTRYHSRLKYIDDGSGTGHAECIPPDDSGSGGYSNTVYSCLPNDPAITGFQDSYTGPLQIKPEFEVPQAP